MKKKVLTLIMSVAIISSSICTPVCAANNSVENKSRQQAASTIDELYDVRAKLSIHMDKNEKDIIAIDKKLEDLGVVEITEEEVMNKYANSLYQQQEENAIMPLYSFVPTEEGVKWTTTTYIYVYRGRQFELEVIRGVAETDLPGNKLYTDSGAITKTYNKAKPTTVVAKGIVNLLLGFVPGSSGTLLSTGLTIAEMFSDYSEATMTSELHNTISSTVTIRTQCDVMLIFVKSYGGADKDKVLMYAGNRVEYDTTVEIPLKNTPVGERYEDIEKFDTSYVYSPDFLSAWQLAVENFLKHQSGTDVNCYYYIRYIKVRLINGDVVTVNNAMPDWL